MRADRREMRQSALGDRANHPQLGSRTQPNALRGIQIAAAHVGTGNDRSGLERLDDGQGGALQPGQPRLQKDRYGIPVVGVQAGRAVPEGAQNRPVTCQLSERSATRQGVWVWLVEYLCPVFRLTERFAIDNDRFKSENVTCCIRVKSKGFPAPRRRFAAGGSARASLWFPQTSSARGRHVDSGDQDEPHRPALRRVEHAALNVGHNAGAEANRFPKIGTASGTSSNNLNAVILATAEKFSGSVVSGIC